MLDVGAGLRSQAQPTQSLNRFARALALGLTLASAVSFATTLSGCLQAVKTDGVLSKTLSKSSSSSAVPLPNVPYAPYSSFVAAQYTVSVGSFTALTLTVRDGMGTPMVGLSTTLLVSGPAGTTISPGTILTAAGGLSNHSLGSTTPGTVNVTVSQPPELSGMQITVAFTSNAPSSVNSTIAMPACPAGNTCMGSIVMRDAGGNPVMGVIPAVSVTGSNNIINGSAGASVNCPTTDATGTSLCSFSSTKAEVKTASVVSPINISSAPFTINPGPATKVQFPPNPAGTYTKEGSTFTMAVELADTYGNPTGTGTNSVTVFKSSGPGTLAGTTTVSAVAGVATFTTLQFTVNGQYDLLAQSGALSTSISDPIYVNPNQLTCNVGNFNPGNTCTINTSITTIPSNADIWIGGNLVITAGAQLSTSAVNFTGPADYWIVDIVGDFTMQTGATMRANIGFLGATNITINPSATIQANGLGYAGGLSGSGGYGTGPNGTGPSGGGGGGGGLISVYGSAAGGGSAMPSAQYGGGFGKGGMSYGTFTPDWTIVGGYVSSGTPTDCEPGTGGGASSGSATGGSGGGCIILFASNSFVMNGTLSATGLAGGNGVNFTSAGGGGGKIYVDALALTGTGVITAMGGAGGAQTSGPSAVSGGGGGGTINLFDVVSNTFSGTTTVAGGPITGAPIGTAIAQPGMPGFIY